MQIVNLSRGPEIILRGTVALQAPLHVKSLGPAGERHLVHRAVAGGAADTFVDVDAVVEKDKIRQVIHPIPFQWLAGR